MFGLPPLSPSQCVLAEQSGDGWSFQPATFNVLLSFVTGQPLDRVYSSLQVLPHGVSTTA
jgi:hypothetical protein